MLDGRRISLCIPNYNRVDMLLEAFEKVYDDERISEIVISDDCSDVDIYEKLSSLFAGMPKIKMFRNERNVDCYRNKKAAIELASNEWCILLDSDNIITKNYLDLIYANESWSENVIYTPSYAYPTFDFRQYESVFITNENVSKWIDKPLFETMLNAANYFVNRNEYLRVWDGSVDPVTSDSIYFCLKWLQAKNGIYVIPNQMYEHRVHSGSHYQNNVRRTPQGFHEEILNKLREFV